MNIGICILIGRYEQDKRVCFQRILCGTFDYQNGIQFILMLVAVRISADPETGTLIGRFKNSLPGIWIIQCDKTGYICMISCVQLWCAFLRILSFGTDVFLSV